MGMCEMRTVFVFSSESNSEPDRTCRSLLERSVIVCTASLAQQNQKYESMNEWQRWQSSDDASRMPLQPCFTSGILVV